MARAPTLEAFLQRATAVRSPQKSGRVFATQASALTLHGKIRVLGIDPGSRFTGWGVIEIDGPRQTFIASGRVACADGPLPQRLRRILDEVALLIEEHRPDESAIEEVFMRRNIASALVLGHARGAALCALEGAKLPIAEYAPAQVKSAIVGNGRAEKTQVQHMVKLLLKLKEVPVSDAADALAIALCHAQVRNTLARTGEALRGSWSRPTGSSGSTP
jgi:crossover junction endodeoxyribonuclease RuvC